MVLRISFVMLALFVAEVGCQQTGSQVSWSGSGGADTGGGGANGGLSGGGGVSGTGGLLIASTGGSNTGGVPPADRCGPLGPFPATGGTAGTPLFNPDAATDLGAPWADAAISTTDGTYHCISGQEFGNGACFFIFPNEWDMVVSGSHASFEVSKTLECVGEWTGGQLNCCADYLLGRYCDIIFRLRFSSQDDLVIWYTQNEPTLSQSVCTRIK